MTEAGCCGRARLSIGIEAPATLIADLEAALDKGVGPVSDSPPSDGRARPQHPALGHSPAVPPAFASSPPKDGVVTLAADGSPGAVLPILGPDRGAVARRRARRHRRSGWPRPTAAVRNQ